MIDRYYRFKVTGNNKAVEEGLAKEGQDPVVLAMRRNHKLLGAESIKVEISERPAFAVMNSSNRQKKQDEISKNARLVCGNYCENYHYQ